MKTLIPFLLTMFATVRLFGASAGMSFDMSTKAVVQPPGFWDANTSAIRTALSLPLAVQSGSTALSNMPATVQSGTFALSNLLAMGITNVVAGTNTVIHTNAGTLVVSALPTVTNQVVTSAGTVNATNTVAASNHIGANFVQTNGFNNAGWWARGGSNVQWRMALNKTLTNVTDVSACAHYPSNNTFFTVHNNNNGRVTEWTLDGVFIRKMDWTSSQVPDAESITYMGGNTFAVVEENANIIIIFSITNNASGSTLDTNNCRLVKIDSIIPVDGAGGGGGVEGIAYDWDRNGWWIAKERGVCQIVFCSNTGASNYVHPAMTQITNANHTDITDLYLDRANQILWITQEEGGSEKFDRVVGLSLLTSNVLTFIDLTNFGQLEGVSMTTDGKLLVAGEVNQFAIFTPELAGLNSSVNYPVNAQTNLPNTVQFPFGVTVGLSGGLLTNTLYASATLDFGSTTVGMIADLPITVAGAENGDVVSVGAPPGSSTTIAGEFTGFASNGVVYVRFLSTGTTQDPASGTFKVRVDKFR